VDRKRKLPVTLLLRAIGFGTDDEIRALFTDTDTECGSPLHRVDAGARHTSNPTTDSEKGVNDALLEFYKKLRPGDPPTLDNARSFVQNLFFSSGAMTWARSGATSSTAAWGWTRALEERILTTDDLVAVIKRIIQINNGEGAPTTSTTWATAASRRSAS
jgi:DNA-directed RNA polymerase subunit beta